MFGGPIEVGLNPDSPRRLAHVPLKSAGQRHTTRTRSESNLPVMAARITVISEMNRLSSFLLVGMSSSYHECLWVGRERVDLLGPSDLTLERSPGPVILTALQCGTMSLGCRAGAMITDVEVREAGLKGNGVFALRPFAAGEFIFRRHHTRVVTASELDDLSEWERAHLSELGFDRFGVLAPPGCYLNHACDPNAMRHGVKVFAWRTIAAGEEVTIDYRLNAFDGGSWPCDCGTRACTGTVVGSFFAMTAERQDLLLPHAPSFIRREYNRRHRAH